MNLYRYVNFCELYNIIKHKKLKFSKLSLMDDLNEGIYQAITSQLPTGLNIGFSKSHEEIVKYHNHIKEHNYISCWTTEKDSMAMWLLYSKDKNSFRIRTTKAKLKKSADRFMKDNCWTKHINSKEGTIQSSNTKAKIKNVEYINLNEVIKKIKNLHKDERIKIKNLDSKNSQHEIWKHAYRQIKEDTSQKAEKLIENPIFIKDKAYQFENEVRVLLDVDMRNNITENEFIKNKYFDFKEYSIGEMDYIMGTATTDFSESKIFPNIIEIDIDESFIEEVCIDPRMLEYQQKIFKEILNIDNKFITSDIFGCMTDEINFGMKYFSDYG